MLGDDLSISTLSFRLIARILPLFLLVPLARAQGTTYSEIWVSENEDGTVTVSGIGTTDDTPYHGFMHDVTVHAGLTGPNGFSFQEATVLGYAQGVAG